MKYTIVTLFAVSLLASFASVSASAEEPQVVVAGTSAKSVRAKLVQAADRLCTAARANDPLGDFGSQDECIENTLDGVEIRHVSYQPQFTQAQPAARATR